MSPSPGLWELQALVASNANVGGAGTAAAFAGAGLQRPVLGGTLMALLVVLVAVLCSIFSALRAPEPERAHIAERAAGGGSTVLVDALPTRANFFEPLSLAGLIWPCLQLSAVFSAMELQPLVESL